MSTSESTDTNQEHSGHGFPAARPTDLDATFDLERVAQLVATGEAKWPAELSERQATELSGAVRHHRRGRLVSLIAKSIAADLARSTARRNA